MAELKSIFGAMVRRQRKALGLSQVTLAERIGVSLETVARVERGVTGVKFEMADRFAEALAVPTPALFGIDTAHDQTGRLSGLMVRLAALSDAELAWVEDLVATGLKRPG